METKEIEAKFIDLVEDRLSEEEAARLRELIDADPELASSYRGYLEVMQVESGIAAQRHTLHENFVVKVMEQIEAGHAPGFFRRIVNTMKALSNINTRIAFGSAATLAVLIVALKLSWDVPVRMPSEILVQEAARERAVTYNDNRFSSGAGGSLLDKLVGRKAKRAAIPASNPHIPQAVGESEEAVKEEVVRQGAISNKDTAKTSRRRAGSGEAAKPVVPQALSESKADRSIRRKLDYGDQRFNQPVEARIDTDSGAAYRDKISGAVVPPVSRPIQAEKTADLAVDRSKALNYAREYAQDLSGGKRQAAAPESLSFKRQDRVFKKPADIMRERHLSAPGVVQQPPVRVNTERYGQWQENEIISVAREAISTFSIDVDTGSYTNARRYLRNGQLPPADSVRIEEFVNYFDYKYPVQGKEPFTLSYEIAPAPLEQDRLLLKLGIKARDAVVDEKRWNLVFLVDVSGSMQSPLKLELVKRSLRLLVKQMRPGDRVALVTYAGSSGVVLPSTGIEKKQIILNAIENLAAGGSTHGSAGIHLAYQVAEQSKLAGGVNRVILATDGDFNVGTTGTAELIGLIEQKRRSGTTLTTLGFGTGNYNEAMMEQLANKGNGNYFYIDSFKEARKVFEDQLTGTMEVIAKDVKLQIEFNPQHVDSYRLIGYENRKLKKEDFNNDRIDAGEIGSGHTVTAMYEVVLTGSKLAGQGTTAYRYQIGSEVEKKATTVEGYSSELAFLKIRYKQPQGSTSKLVSFPIDRAHILESSQKASDDFRFAAAVSYFGHLLRGSKFTGQYSFSDIARLAAGAVGDDRQGYRREFIDLVRNAGATQ